VDPGLIIIILFLLAPLLERLLKVGRPPQEPPEGQLPQQRQPGQRMPGQRLPGQTLPGPRPPVPDDEDQPFRSVPAADAEADRSAATMLPDDLWEILTGEKRAPAQPPLPQAPPQRAPAGRANYEAAPAEVGPAGDAARAAERRRLEAQSRERDRLRRRERDPGAATTRERAPTPSRERRLPPVSMRSRQGTQPQPTRRGPAGPPGSPADDYIREMPVHEVPVVVPFDAPPLDGEERHARFADRRSRMSAPATVERGPKSVDYSFKGPADVRRAFVMSEILGRPKGLEE
jgi:hypothetical protein